jgi:long-chain acyl-CoA synthetase
MGSDPLVDNAVVVGSDRKFCAALLFPVQDQVRALTARREPAAEWSIDDLLADPDIVDAYRAVVQGANEGMEPWSTVKRFALIPDKLTVESDLLTPTLKIRRPEVRKAYTDEIEALYDEAAPTGPQGESGMVLVEV